MLTTKRKPTTVGEILTEEFMQPMGLTQGALAEAMGVSWSKIYIKPSCQIADRAQRRFSKYSYRDTVPMHPKYCTQ